MIFIDELMNKMKLRNTEYGLNLKVLTLLKMLSNYENYFYQFLYSILLQFNYKILIKAYNIHSSRMDCEVGGHQLYLIQA